MREFMTKVSDYLNERRNNPGRQEDKLAVVIIGAAAVVMIVALLLVLWGHVAGERAQKKAQSGEENMLTSTTYQEEMAEYMAPSDGQEMLKQEYLANIEYLNNKVEELLSSLTQVEQNLSETIEQYDEENTLLRNQMSELHTEVTNIVQNLKETQTELCDLIDIVQVMNQETIPMIQEQIAGIRGDIEQVHSDIADLYTKIAGLEQEDAKLWASIDNLEKVLEKRIGGLAGQTLQYRYDEGTNTLYLEPYKE